MTALDTQLLQALLTVVVGRLDDHSQRMLLMSQNSDLLKAAVDSLTAVINGNVVPELQRLKALPASDGVDATLPALTDAINAAVSTLQAAIAASQA
jgi:hypothetical protein